MLMIMIANRFQVTYSRDIISPQLSGTGSYIYMSYNLTALRLRSIQASTCKEKWLDRSPGPSTSNQTLGAKLEA